MEIYVKTFDELTKNELYEVLQLRETVFVVEQKCPYQEIDGLDKQALHVIGRENGEIVAYLRVMGKGVAHEEASIGRVIALRRRQGLGSQILHAGIQTAISRLGVDCIYLEAQTYAKSLYEKQGFQQVSEEFMLDGIPHVGMLFKTGI